MILERTEIQGSGKGSGGWFDLRQANVTYDHPFHAKWEHALNLDFIDESAGPAARVAVELSPESARQLAESILAILDRGAAFEAATAQ
jgi:hypothetical protein